MNGELCGTALTGDKLSQLLQRSEKFEVNGHKLEDIQATVIGVGQGFMSKVLRATLNWSKPQPNLPTSVVVKVIGGGNLKQLFPDMTEKARERAKQSLNQAHDVECKIYNLKGLSDVVPMPTCYGMTASVGDDLGILILEDLGDRSMALPMTMMGIGLTAGQLDNFLDTLATLHAWSVNTTDWRKDVVSLSEGNIAGHLMENLLNTFRQSKKLYPNLLETLGEDKLSAFINSRSYVELFGGDPRVKYDLPLVLVHGDVRTMNIMFDKISDRQSGDKVIALLDWQMAHQGCAVEDLTRLFILCVSTEVRREKTDQILQRYVKVRFK